MFFRYYFYFNRPTIVFFFSERLLFWSDFSQHPVIESCGLDGSQRRVVVSSKLVWPSALALDLPTKRLYFADARLDYIEFVNYDGSGRRTVVNNDHVSVAEKTAAVESK